MISNSNKEIVNRNLIFEQPVVYIGYHSYMYYYYILASFY